ncbi:MAG TPA: hypothetical protein VK507_07330 [Iamia sp.]|nr:hypothetical protein [Iamia sp.]
MGSPPSSRIVRHGAGAVSGLLVWWFVVENLVLAFAPAEVGRFLPFDAGYRMLDVGSDLDDAELLAAQLSHGQSALVFGAYAVVALAVGTVLLHRRDVG